MNMKLVIFLLCFKIADLNNVLNILEPTASCFYKIYFDMFYITNTVFSMLKLKTNFTNSTHINMLIRMINFQTNKYVTNNCKVMELLGIISTITDTKNNSNDEAVLQNVVTEEIDILKKNVMNKGISLVNRRFRVELNSSENIEDISEESLEFFEQDPFTSSNRKLMRPFQPLSNKNREIKSWKPPSSNNFDLRRIYKGKKSKIKNYSFLVSIHIMNEFLCSGSIISKDTVITSASCLKLAYNNKYYRDNSRTIFVRIASDYTKRSGELIPIIQVIFHPEYEPVTLKHNVAIIKMLAKLKKTKKRKIKRIRYGTNDGRIDDGVKSVTIIGWGITDENQSHTDLQRLKMADIDVYDFEDCQEIYSKYYVTETNFCAGFVNKGGGACTGDVGGPAVANGKLVGIISFGPTVCGMTDAPTVFTKVGHYTDWINNVINQDTALRFDKEGSGAYLKPNLLLVPTFSKTSQTTTARIKLNPKNKSNSKVNTTTVYPKDILLLKKIIHEYILSNSTVLDYLVNGDTIDDKVADIDDADELFDPNITEEKLLAQRYYQNHSNLPNKNFYTADLERKVTNNPKSHQQRQITRTKVYFEKSKSKKPLPTLIERYKVTDPTIQEIYDSEETIYLNESSYYEEGMSVEIPISYKYHKLYQPPNPVTDTKLNVQTHYKNEVAKFKAQKSFEGKNTTKRILRFGRTVTQKKGTTHTRKKTTYKTQLSKTEHISNIKKYKLKDVQSNFNKFEKSNHHSEKQKTNQKARSDKNTQHEKSENKQKTDEVYFRLFSTREVTESQIVDPTKKTALGVFRNGYNYDLSDVSDGIHSDVWPLGLAMNISDEEFAYIDNLYHEEINRLEFDHDR